MKILPVNILNFRGFKSNSETVSIPNLAPMPKDSVSFSGKAMTAKAFKKFSRSCVDFYTGRPMLDERELAKMKEDKFFTGTIRQTVNKLKKYYNEEIFEPIEKQVFERIMEAAKKSPETKLDELFNEWYMQTRKDLRKRQTPIFEQIKELGEQLPKDKQKEFKKFMERTDKMLYDKPVLKAFKFKEFQDKMNNYLKKITDNKIKHYITKNLERLEKIEKLKDEVPMEEIKTNDKYFKELIIKNLNSPKSKKKLIREANLEIKKDIINEIYKKANENGYKKIANLCQTSIDMLDKKPVEISFRNKAFKYELTEIIYDIPNVELKEKMIQLTNQLPTSAQCPEALILKLKDAEPNIIGERLLNPSLVSIEHMVPQSLNGPDTMANCVLARRGINSRRGSEPLYITLKKYKPENQQKYAECVVRLQRKGKIPYEDAMEHFNTIEKEGHVDLSQQKKKLVAPQAPVDYYNMI